MALTPRLKRRIIQAFEASRRSLPPISDVAARPNRRRLASLSRPRGKRTVLNLSTAVVEAGEEAWVVVAPALEGDRESLRRLQRLAAPGMLRNRDRSQGVAEPGAPGSTRPGAPGSERPAAAPSNRTRSRRPGAAPSNGTGGLPPANCEGTPAQRRYLRRLVEYVRESNGCADAIPADVQLRVSRRMTSSLGLCTTSGASRRVTIAERILRPGLEDIAWETVKHELAHLADQVTRKGGRPGHGPGWRRWARHLGARPQRLCSREEARRIGEIAARRGRGPLRYPTEVRRWLAARRKPAAP